MKHLLRGVFANVVALYATQLVIPGLSLGGEFYRTLIISGGTLFLLNSLLKPIFNLFLLPINILTLGTLRWLVNVATLYILTRLIPQVSIHPFYFPGLQIAGISIPSLELGLITTFVITSITVSLITETIRWIID